MGNRRKTKSSHDRQPANQKGNEGKINQNYIPIIVALNRLADEKHTENYENTPKENSKLCREIATIIGLFATVLVGIGAIFITHKDASEQIISLTKQLRVVKSDQRPWMGPPEIIVNRDGPKVLFKFVFKNVGRNPTDGLDIDAKLTSSGNWPNQIDKLCEDRREKITNGSSTFALWSAIPQATFPIIHLDSFTDNNIGIDIDDLKKIISPVFVGCIIYGHTLTGLRHKTGFVAFITISIDDKVSVEDIYAIKSD